MNIKKKNWLITGEKKIYIEEIDAKSNYKTVCELCHEIASENELNARLISNAPQLYNFALKVIKVGKGNAPSVGFMSELIELAEKITEKISS